jgi:hypothetical protein
MELSKRLQSLAGNLDKFDPNDLVPWQTALIFNALLDDAKTQYSNDPIIAVIEPATGDGIHANGNVGSMRASVGQLFEAAQGR